MLMASGSADARSPPLRPAEATITVAIEKAHMVIPSACVVLPAGQPATTRRPLEPHRRHGGWRHPPPSGSPSGPVGPSGRNSNPDFPVQPRRPLGAKRNLEGGRGRVKATFPLATRVCPAYVG